MHSGQERFGGRLKPTLCWLVAAGSLVLTPAAGAAPVALLDAPRAREIALAGREVVVARTAQHARVAVDAVGIDSGAARRLLSIPSPGRGWLADVRVAGSPQRVGVLVAYTDDEGNTREWRVYSGPVAGPLAVVLRVRTSRSAWIPGDVDVDADRVLVTEIRLREYRTRARVLVPGAPAAQLPWPGTVFSPAALAGDRVAFLGATHRDIEGPIDQVFLADWRSGAVEAVLNVRDPDDVDDRGVDLAADGRVLVAVDGKLFTAAPGIPQARLGGSALSSPRFAGAWIAALRAARFDARKPVALEPGGGGLQSLGAPSTTLETLVADERGVAWLANGCVLYAPLDGAAPAARPCPTAEVVLEERDQTLRGRTVRIAVTCIAAPAGGCRGTAILRAGRVLGRRAFHVPAGARRPVDVTLTRQGARWVRRNVRRFHEATYALRARVRDGRAPRNAGGYGGIIDRVAR